jgi:hypothetical protein
MSEDGETGPGGRPLGAGIDIEQDERIKEIEKWKKDIYKL